MANGVFLSSVTSLESLTGGFVLHPFSCQVAYICSILPKYFPFTVCFYISLFLGLYEDFISIVFTAPYNIVIVSLMNRSFMFLF